MNLEYCRACKSLSSHRNWSCVFFTVNYLKFYYRTAGCLHDTVEGPASGLSRKAKYRPDLYGRPLSGVALLHSGIATSWAFPSSRIRFVLSSGPQWQEWAQEVVSKTEHALGSGKESVGGGEGESVPGSEVEAPEAPPCWPLRFWTFLLSSFRSTLSARRSLSSRCTLPWRASNSLSRTAFCYNKDFYRLSEALIYYLTVTKLLNWDKEGIIFVNVIWIKSVKNPTAASPLLPCPEVSCCCFPTWTDT